MSSATRLLAPFDFRADFSQQETGPAEVRLTPEEVIALIGKVRADTIAEAQRQQSTETLERLEGAASALREALGQVVGLMSQIEAIGYDGASEERLRAAVNLTATRLIDGQGDLFAAVREFSTKLDNAPAGGPRRGDD